MLQYLISGNNASEIVSIASQALNSGCRWIRVDLSELPLTDFHTTVKSLQDKCNECEAYLSIENDVEIVAQQKLAGIHLAACHLPNLVETRKVLGEEPIMGITVEDYSQVPFLPKTAIDYVAVKGDDLDNCRKTVQQMRESNFDEPIVATLTPGISIDELMATGVDGIAVEHITTPPSMLQALLKKVEIIMQQRLKGL